MIIANIVPVLSGGIKIGSDVMKALQVTIPYNDDKTAMLTVDGQSITFQYRNLAHELIPKSFIRTMNVTKSSSRTSPSLNPSHSFNALFYGDSEDPEVKPPSQPRYKRPIHVKLRASVQSEYDTAMQDPTKYMCEFDYHQPVSIPQLVALHCILHEYDVVVGRESNYLSRTGVQRDISITYAESTTASLSKYTTDTIYDKYINHYVNSVRCLINSNNDPEQRDVCHDYIAHKIDSLHNVQYINKLAVVNGEVVDDAASTPVTDKKQEQEDLIVTAAYIDKTHKRYCKKIILKKRWDKFKNKCNPPERLQDVIKQIMKIDISKENLSRIAEEPYFRAQCLVNLHIYAHPDPSNPPSVKGREYEINLTDTSPCTNPMRRTSLLEKAYLYWRTKQLMGRNMIGVSS